MSAGDYKLWFKAKLGSGIEHSAAFDDIVVASLVWDMLDEAGWYMMCQRPMRKRPMPDGDSPITQSDLDSWQPE